GARAFVSIEGALEVLRRREGKYRAPVGEAEQRQLLTFEELFHNDRRTRVPEAAGDEALVEGAHCLIPISRYVHAFPCSQAVGFDDVRRREVIEERRRLTEICEGARARGRRACLLHDLLRPRLRAFD